MSIMYKNKANEKRSPEERIKSLKNAIEQAVLLASKNRLHLEMEFKDHEIEYKNIKAKINGKLDIKLGSAKDD